MPPLLYLIRHAHAPAAGDDAAREIGGRGRKEIAQLAALLRPSAVFRPVEVWHSPLVRARQTAELLLGELQLKAKLSEHRELEPEADPERIAVKLESVSVPLALFGHEPHLSSLASLLVTGYSAPVVFAFQKATALGLEPGGRGWWVRWQLSPDLFA